MQCQSQLHFIAVANFRDYTVLKFKSVINSFNLLMIYFYGSFAILKNIFYDCSFLCIQ